MPDATPPSSPGADDRYSRQERFAPFGAAGQERLRGSRVLIVGCGALGSHTAESLTRAGVGALRLVDRDLVEWSNLQRQLGFDEEDARQHRPKAEALARHLRRVNSEVAVEPCVENFGPSNADRLSEGCTVYLDGTDNVPARFLLNDLSFRERRPWIYAGAIEDRAHVQFFDGERGPCLRCQLPDLPPPGTLKTCDTAGVLEPTVAIAAAWQVAFALRWIAEGSSEALRGRRILSSLWQPAARVVAVEGEPDCSVCVRREFRALAGELLERATVLCGRSAVQVLPGSSTEPFDLAATAARLQQWGPLEERPGLLRVAAGEGITLTLFRDGRAIFDGLTDTRQARSLYARFIGH